MIRISDILSHFKEAENEIDEQFSKHAIVQKFSEGQFLTMEGDACHYFPIVKTGVVRVYKFGESGQEITLYRISPGESCILTVSCLISSINFPAVAKVEKDCEIILIPSFVLKDWINRYEIWRHYILDYLSQVISNVLSVVEKVVFKRIDQRIIEHISNLANQEGLLLNITHQQIANDLGTAREVVSRLLKSLEKENLIQLSRGHITIKNLFVLNKKASYLQ